jgi:hypothetical protein
MPDRSIYMVGIRRPGEPARRWVRCENCDGLGIGWEWRYYYERGHVEREPGPEQRCDDCDGTGWVADPETEEDGA